MPSRTARRSSTHHSSVAPEDGYSNQSANDDATTDDRSNVEDPKYVLATRFLATMMREVIIDNALLAHKSVVRQKRAQGHWKGGCPVCKANCQAPPDAASHGSSVKVEGNANSESGEAASTTSAQPKGLEIYHNNPLLACMVCSRQVSANRYAQHLASCVGVGKGGLARRKGKSMGSSKVKTALENRKKAGLYMSGASTPIHRMLDDGAANASDDEAGRRKNSLSSSSLALGLNGNGKRSASPADETPNHKKTRMGTPLRLNESRSQSLLGASSVAASQPAMGSPLNPNRTNKSIVVDDSDELTSVPGKRGKEIVVDDDDDEEEEGAISNSLTHSNVHRSSKLAGGSAASSRRRAHDESSDVYVPDDSGVEANDDSDDGSYEEAKGKRDQGYASAQSDDDDDY